MSSGKGGTVTGFRYRLGLHFVLCQTMDYLRGIRMEDRDAWKGIATDQQISVNRPGLFGDPDVEGGFSALVDVMGGGEAQAINEYLQTKIDPDNPTQLMPAFRGVASAVYRRAYIGNAPFLRTIWHHVTGIHHTYNNWLPAYAPVPSQRLNVTDRESGYIFFAIDVSYSMFEPAFSRWEAAKTLISDALESLKGKSPNLMLVTFDEASTARDSVQYLDATDADLDAAIAWLNAITYQATAGVDAGSDYRGGIDGAAAFFALDDDADQVGNSAFSGVAGLQGLLSGSAETDENASSARQLFFVSDGRPVPTSSATDARASLDQINGLQIHGLAVNNDDPTYADILTNLPSEIAGSIGETEKDLAVALSSYSVTDSGATIIRPSTDYSQWQVVTASWPAANRSNFGVDSFGKFSNDWGDIYNNHNTGSSKAFFSFDVTSEPSGAQFHFRMPFQIYRNTATDVSIAQNEHLFIYGLTQAEADANAQGTLVGDHDLTNGTAYLEGYTNRVLELEWNHNTAFDVYRVEFDLTDAFAPGGGAGYRITNYEQPIISVSNGDPVSLGTGQIQDALTDHYDINPIHVVRDFIVNPRFGGLGDASVIGDSFEAGAVQCFNEGLGISAFFENPRDKDANKKFIEEHIDGHFFRSRATGKWEVKLIRDDYDVGTLFTFDTSEITEWVGLERPLQEELPNQVTAVWTKRENGDPASVTVHNVAAIQQLGFINPAKREYRGFTVEELAAKAAMRDLRGMTVPLWRGKFRALYAPTDLNIGSEFILNDARVGLANIVCRITEIDEGDGRSNAPLISFVQDKFSLDDTAIVVGDDGLVPDRDTALPPMARLAAEMPYFIAATTLGESELEGRLTEDPDLGFMMATSDRPNQYHVNIAIAEYNGSEWYKVATATAAPLVVLDSPMTGDADDTTFTGPMSDDLLQILESDLIQIDSEIMTVVDITVANDIATVTVGRGALDTVPERHEIGAAALFFYNAIGSDLTAYTSGQSLDVKLLPRTRSQVYSPALADTDTVVFDSRLIRPYPPGAFQLDGAYSVTGVQVGDLVGTWSHRDRLTQTVVPPEDYTDPDVGPEAGVSYTPQRRILNHQADVFDLADVFANQDIFTENARRGPFDYASTTGKTHTFSADDADLFDAADIFDLADIFDDAFDVNTAAIELGVKSTRGGYDNWQTKWIRVDPLLPPFNLTATEV